MSADHFSNDHVWVRVEQSCDLWKGEQWTEWTGPLRGLNEKTAGALSVTLWPSVGAAAGVWVEKEHLSSRPPSEPTRKVSESQGDKAREVTPTVLLPRAYGQQKATCYSLCMQHTPTVWESFNLYDRNGIHLVSLLRDMSFIYVLLSNNSTHLNKCSQSSPNKHWQSMWMWPVCMNRIPSILLNALCVR